MKKLILILSIILSAFVSFAQPANDLCSGAQVTSTSSGCVAGTLVGAGDNLAGCAGCQGAACNQHKDVWYSFVAVGNTFQFTLTGGTLVNGEVILASSTGPCAGLVLVNSTCGSLPLSGTYSGLVNGTTYYVIVSAPGNQTGTFSLCTTDTSSPGLDCSSATSICSNSSFSGNSTGFGTQELNATNQGCLSIEHQSSWYTFTIQTSGTLNMTLSPGVGVDYDYALWGPASACPPNAPPIRCSFASGGITFLSTGSYNTGIGAPGTEVSDGTGGTLDGWTSTLNVTAGQVYILLIDNFTANATPFTLNWGGTATLNCSILPIEIVSFNGYDKNSYNLLNWVSVTETNNDYYTVERSIDGIVWDEVSKVDGAGNSNTPIYYEYKDYTYQRETYNYYRLKQTDFNGNYEYFNIIAIDNNIKSSNKTFIKATNLMGQEVPTDTEGVLIYYYSDGTHQKVCKIR